MKIPTKFAQNMLSAKFAKTCHAICFKMNNNSFSSLLPDKKFIGQRGRKVQMPSGFISIYNSLKAYRSENREGMAKMTKIEIRSVNA